MYVCIAIKQKSITAWKGRDYLQYLNITTEGHGPLVENSSFKGITNLL